MDNDGDLLILSGSPYEIGLKHGEKTKRKIVNSLETYETLFEEFASISWPEAIEKAKLHIDAIDQYNHRYLEEMDGVAKGAGVTFEDILTLNARSEIALTNAPDGCTSFALTNPKTDKTWLAQNWDWRGSQIDSLVYLQIEQENMPTIKMVTEAGIIGKIGSNSAGIGVCLNAIVTNVWEPKVPIHLGLRAVLESETLAEAVGKVRMNQMASPAHFLVASDKEGLVGLEVSPVQTEQLQTINGVLAHTNHLCSLKMINQVNEDPIADSFDRLTTISELLNQLDKRDITEKDLFQVLSNHDGYPSSICRHVSSEQVNLARSETVFSIVMNLSDRKLSWIEGKPCEHSFAVVEE